MLSHAANLLPSQLAIGLAHYLFRLGTAAFRRVQFAGIAQVRSRPCAQVHPGRPRYELALHSSPIDLVRSSYSAPWILSPTTPADSGACGVRFPGS